MGNAFSDQALNLAADIEPQNFKVSREIKIFHGRFYLKVFPEIEGGRIDLETGTISQNISSDNRKSEEASPGNGGIPAELQASPTSKEANLQRFNILGIP